MVLRGFSWVSIAFRESSIAGSDAGSRCSDGNIVLTVNCNCFDLRNIPVGVVSVDRFLGIQYAHL
jgi:hypothetical protein